METKEETREDRGLQIAARNKLTRNGNVWLVPSQAGKGKYEVDSEAKRCTCPDFEARQAPCKHLFAVQIVIQREYSNDGETQTYTETVTVKKTYKQEWTAYNKAQTHEKARFLSLLAELCSGIDEPVQPNGRPRLPLADMIFATTFKVYSTMSGRRFTSDLTDAHRKGYLTRAPHYNSISRYFENPTLTPFLKELIEISSLPLQTVERDFAIDSSGFATSRFIQWMHAKYSNPRLIEKKQWVKVHLCCGVKTNVVTAVEITDQFGADCPQFKGLVETTGRNFTMDQVSADKAYLSSDNLQTVVDHHATPFIPFKSNSTGNSSSPQTALWKRLFHFYSFNQERFMQNYHKRSNVETTFSMIKAKFGDGLRSKTKTAQVNEALCKVLAHNLCCVIQSIYELGIEPTFWTESN